jgi:uncharacterized HAD superfamily protein
METTIINNYLVDIDGTVSEDIPNEEDYRFAEAEVLDGAVERINSLYDQGHTITFFTSRLSKHYDVTIDWLKRKGFKFHRLITDKPRGGRYIWVDNLDVKGVKFQGTWETVDL